MFCSSRRPHSRPPSHSDYSECPRSAQLEAHVNVFPIAPAESRYVWMIIPVTVLLIVICVGGVALLATSVRGAHSSCFEVLVDGLILHGDLLGRLTPSVPMT